MSSYTVIIERTATGFSAYVPDLPGCVAAARTRAVVLRLLREAVRLHIEGLVEDGCPVPKPRAEARSITARVPRRRAS